MTFYRLSSISNGDRWPYRCRLVANYVTFYNLQAVGNKRLKIKKGSNLRSENLQRSHGENGVCRYGEFYFGWHSYTIFMARLPCTVIYVLCREVWVRLVLSIDNNRNHLAFCYYRLIIDSLRMDNPGEVTL